MLMDEVLESSGDLQAMLNASLPFRLSRCRRRFDAGENLPGPPRMSGSGDLMDVFGPSKQEQAMLFTFFLGRRRWQPCSRFS